MGGAAFEVIARLIVGQGAAASHTVGIAGMPGQGCIQVIEGAVAGKKPLASAALLCGTAEKNNGASWPRLNTA